MDSTEENYKDLQQGIDKLIGKFGIKKAIRILRQLSGTSLVKEHSQQQLELITVFVVSEACKVFEVDKKEKEGKLTKEFKQARMAGYHLLSQYTRLSYPELGKHFGQGKFGAYYHIRKCREILSIPQFNKPFVERYKLIEENLIQFMAKMN